uniref:Uncharacterized protein n=1 Tax=Tanacetum cinerariifolium TaxID=118510 RepID=A0A6L2LMI4_TANCI|nr:hypothetical protein [Tanacetum cinerariifolium]
MSHSTVLIPSDFTGESVGSSASLVILSNTKEEVMAILAVLPEIAPRAETAVVPSPTPVLDFVIESDLEAEPSEAPLSPDYVPASSIHAPASPHYHPGSDTESKPFEDDSEVPIEDVAPAAAKPPPTQITHTSSDYPYLTYRAYICQTVSRSSLPAASPVLAFLSFTPADRLPPRKRFRGSPTISYQDATVETTAELVIPSVYHSQTIKDRLASLKRDITYLRAKVRVKELSDDSTRVALETARTGLAKMRRRVGDTTEHLQQCQIACMYDKERI